MEPSRARTPPPVDARKAEFFRALGHPARIGLLQALGRGERTVGALQAELGMESSSTSQHLGALRRQGLVAARRQGTSVHYRLKDVRVLELLDSARAILIASLTDDEALLHGLAQDDAT
ncbi:MAG: ArsR/SmtB family transcription factor [Thermoleophilia bacterium]